MRIDTPRRARRTIPRWLHDPRARVLVDRRRSWQCRSFDEDCPYRTARVLETGPHVQWLQVDSGVSVISPCRATHGRYVITGIGRPRAVCCLQHVAEVIWQAGLTPPHVGWMGQTERWFAAARHRSDAATGLGPHLATGRVPSPPPEPGTPVCGDTRPVPSTTDVHTADDTRRPGTSAVREIPRMRLTQPPHHSFG